MREAVGRLALRGGRHNLALVSVVGTFVLLALGYSLVTPIFEAPDELWHFLHVKYIRDNKALIVQSEAALENPARQEGGQPPLYYLLSATIISWLETGPMADVVTLNFDAQPGKIETRLNKNVVVHADDEGFPYSNVPLAVHTLRAFSVFLAAGTVVTTYAIAKELFSGVTTIPLGAAAFNAFLPQFVFVSASVNNDNLVIFLSSLVLVNLLHLAKSGLSPRRVAIVGLLVGLAILTKISAIGLLPLAIATVFVTALRGHNGAMRREQQSGAEFRFGQAVLAAKAAMILIVGPLVVAGWWFVRNYQLYGDPLAVNVFLHTVNRSIPVWESSLSLADLQLLATSFLALFGWSNVAADPYVYWFLGGIVIVGFLGALCAIVHIKRWPDCDAVLLFIPIAWLAMLVGGLFTWATAVGFDVGRLLFPAISVIAILVTTGVVSLVGARVAPVVVFALSIALFFVAASMPFIYIRPAYKHGLQFASAVDNAARPLNATFGNRIRLVSYELSRDAVVPGERVSVTLYWELLGDLDDGVYRMGLDANTEDRQRNLSQVYDLLAEPGIARRAREKGWLLRGRYDLDVPKDAQANTHLPIVVHVLDRADQRLPVVDGLWRAIGNEVVVARIRVDER